MWPASFEPLIPGGGSEDGCHWCCVCEKDVSLLRRCRSCSITASWNARTNSRAAIWLHFNSSATNACTAEGVVCFSPCFSFSMLAAAMAPLSRRMAAILLGRISNLALLQPLCDAVCLPCSGTAVSQINSAFPSWSIRCNGFTQCQGRLRWLHLSIH